MDAASFDAGVDGNVDANDVDAGAIDANAIDAFSVDAFAVDAFSVDAGTDVGPDASCTGRGDCDGTPGCETVLGTVTHCTMCGEVCRAPANATPSCPATSGCAWACSGRFANCDTVDGNGCESNTDTDPLHCGDCATSCGVAPANAMRVCTGGDCLRSCLATHGDCDRDLASATSNGCEQALNTLANCAECGRACAPLPTAMFVTASCSTGTCRITCVAGHLDCDGNAVNGCEVTGITCS